MPEIMTRTAAAGRPGPTELSFVRDPQAARSLLDPLRQEILLRLQEPGSSSSVAQALDLPRQRVNYHVRELEEGGLLRHVEDRKRGNCVERVLQESARRFVVDPRVVGTPASTVSSGESTSDPFSSASLIRIAAQTLTTVGELHEEALAEGRRVPTMSSRRKANPRIRCNSRKNRSLLLPMQQETKSGMLLRSMAR